MKQKCNKEYPYYCMNPDHTHGNEYYSGTCYCGQNGANPRETLEYARRVNLDMLKEAKLKEAKLPTQGEMIEVRDKHNDYEQKWQGGKIFVCEYKGRILAHPEGVTTFSLWDEWRYPKKETVTLKRLNASLMQGKEAKIVIDGKEYSVTLKLI